MMAGRYAHTKQFKRMRRTLKKQRTVLGHCTLHGVAGDVMFALLCGCGQNLQLILNVIRRFCAHFIGWFAGSLETGASVVTWCVK